MEASSCVINYDNEDKKKIEFIKRIIKKYRLNMEGLTVFTEAASGNYMYTAIAAAMAGATRVYAIAADSRYGSFHEIKLMTMQKAEQLMLVDKIVVVKDKSPEVLKYCDIITNSGFVRPITKEMISYLKPTAVIPLMWEAWELRKDELDIDACSEKGILVMGTNEHDERLNLFRTIGFKTCKLLFDAGLTVYNDNYLLISSGDYGNSIADFFNNNSIKYDRIVLDEYVGQTKIDICDCHKQYLDKLNEYDAVIIAELNNNVEIISDKGLISSKFIEECNPLIKIIYICGVVDKQSIVDHQLDLFPQRTAAFGHISISADYLGWKPVLELNIAGLKVGEAMARSRLNGLSVEKSRCATLLDSPADPLVL